MKKDFETRFMPNVKFLIPKDMLNDLLLEVLYSSIRCEDRCPFPVGAVTSSNGDTISTICNSNDSYKYFNYIKEVSIYEAIYEAIPELIPDGMRYNKELDKLVPDVIGDKKSAADEYFTGIDLRKKEIIKKRENGFIKADLEKLDFSLVDSFAYSDLAFQLTVGAKKYSKDNWKKGDINIYLSALERHIQDIKKALDEDDIEKLIDDTGIQHGGALLCNSMFIHYFIRQILKDKNAK